MESNEQNAKQNRDRLIENRMSAKSGGGFGGRGFEQKGKRTHGHGDCEVGEGGIRVLNGNGKKNFHKQKNLKI